MNKIMEIKQSLKKWLNVKVILSRNGHRAFGVGHSEVYTQKYETTLLEFI